MPGSSTATIASPSRPPRRRATVPHRRNRTSFAIDRKGNYRIEGAAFLYSDRDTGRTTTILGHPTDTIAQAE
jgi:hypothetical protein